MASESRILHNGATDAVYRHCLDIALMTGGMRKLLSIEMRVLML